MNVRRRTVVTSSTTNNTRSSAPASAASRSLPSTPPNPSALRTSDLSLPKLAMSSAPARLDVCTALSSPGDVTSHLLLAVTSTNHLASDRDVALPEEDSGDTNCHDHIQPNEHKRSRIGYLRGASQPEGNKELARQPLIATRPHVREQGYPDQQIAKPDRDGRRSRTENNGQRRSDHSPGQGREREIAQSGE